METPRKNTFNLPNPNRGGYDIQKLREKHHLILRMVARGLTYDEVADYVGCTKQTVYNTVNSTLGQQKLAVLRGQADLETIDMISSFKELAPIALSVTEDVMLDRGAKHGDRLRAAETVLNGAGHGRHTVLEVNHNIPSKEEIAEARRASIEKMRSAGMLVEDTSKGEYEDAKVIEDNED